MRLTALLEKEGFSWTKMASAAFTILMNGVTTTLLLALPNFAQPFVMEWDASTYGFSVVLI